MTSASSTEPSQKHLSWHHRPVRTALLLLGAGSLVPSGCGYASLVGDANPLLAVTLLVLGLSGGVGGVAVLRLVSRKRLGIIVFSLGACVSVIVVCFTWAPIANWYNMMRCRDGVAGACMRLSVKRSVGESDDFYAPRRGCALGKVYACGSMFKWDVSRNAETCESVRRICANENHAASKKTACWLADQHCTTSTGTVPPTVGSSR